MSLSSFPFGPASGSPGGDPNGQAFGGRLAFLERLLGGEGLFRNLRRDFWPKVIKSWRVIEAMILRESITRYGRRSAGFVWALINPMLLVGVMMLLFTFMGRQPAAGEYLSVFFITGIIPVMAWRNAAVQGAGAITGNRGLLNYPQIRPLHIVVARTILELAISGLVVLLFVAGFWTFMDVPITAWIDEPLTLLQALGCLALLCYGSAVLSSQIGRVFQLWGTIMSRLGRILFFTSGLWYTFASLPTGPRALMVYNPLAHNIEWLRDGVIPGFESEFYNPGFPLSVGVIFLAAGLCMEWLIAISTHVDD